MKRSSPNDLFMNAFNFSTIGMAVVSMDGKWLKVNSSLCQSLGYSAAELGQMTEQELTYPEDVALDLSMLNKLLKGETESDERVKRYINSRGQMVWAKRSITLVKDDQGHPLHLLLLVQDITEQKELQEKLKKSEERYRKLVQYSPEPMVIHVEGRLIYVNEAGVKVIGAKSYRQLVGQNIMDYIHPKHKEKVLQRIEQMIDSNEQLEPYDSRLIDTKGQERYVRLSSVPIDYEGIKAIQTFFSDITQRKRMEETIRKNEAQYKSLIEHNPDAVFMVDLEGSFTQVNESCTRITGYSEAELLGMSLESLFIEEEKQKAIQLFTDTLQGVDHPQDYFIHKKNGEKAIVHETAIPIVIDGKVIGLYVVLKDVTEQKRMEKEYKQSEERYRALVESSPNAIVVQQEGKIVYANPKFSQLLKADSDEAIIGRSITEYIHPDFHEIVQERIEQLEQNSPVGSLEEKYVLFDGTVIDVEVTANPIVYMDKLAFQVIIHDISERKEIEYELHQSQEQYRSVVENVKEVIFQTDREGRWTFLNPAWEKMTGYPIHESLWNRFDHYICEEDRERFGGIFQAVLQGEKEFFREEVRFRTKTDGCSWFEIYTRVTLNDQGVRMGTLGTLNDITKRKEYEEELKASEERFRLLAEYSSDLITMHDRNRAYLYVSPACKDVLQYEEAELTGTVATSFVHPEDQGMVNEQFQKIFETGYVVITFRMRRKDGEYIWMESACKLLDGRHSGEQKLIAVSRNINDRKLAEQKLQEANEILQRLSTIDGLTGVSNRRAFEERMDKEWNHGRRSSSFLSLVMFDLDFFKAYNDTYGHQGGDSCLKQIAAVINESLERSTDLLCRYGGEEFCVILPETDEAGARIVGEKIRQAIERLNIPHTGSRIHPYVTISVGTATMIPTIYTSYLELVSRADKALYKAKNEGRNCVRTY